MRWGFKKKLTRETWHTIGQIIKNRDEAERISHVYAYGKRLLSDKVKKETARYKTCDENGECCTKRLLPAGIEVRSDEEEVEETILSLEPQNIHSNNPLATQPPVETHALGAPWNPAPSPGSFQPIDPQVFELIVMNTRPSPIQVDEWSQNAKIWETASLVSSSQPSPFNRCDDVFGHLSLGTSTFEKVCTIPRNTIALFTNLNTPLFREFRALLKDNQPKIFASINQMRHLLPSEPNQLQKASVDLVILKQILYLLMNNFAGSDYAVFDTIFEQVRQFPVAHMEDMLDALPDPYAAALQQSILTIAIKSNILALVEVILRRGLDSDRVTCRFFGQEFTPLGLACMFRHLEVVKALLRAGADPNRTPTRGFEATPVTYLLRHSSRHSEVIFPPVVCNILQQLLDHHAKMFWSDIVEAKFWASTNLLDIFIHHNKLPVNFQITSIRVEKLDQEWLEISSFCQQEKITAALQSILGISSILPNCNDIPKSSMIPLLRDASYKGNLSLIEFLLERIGLTPDSTCLCAAARGNQPLLVKKYLQMGMDITKSSQYSQIKNRVVKTLSSNVDPYLLEGYWVKMETTTPFAEAIRSDSQEMINLLKSHDVLNTVTDMDNFGPAILAAAETGNTDIVQELLETYEKGCRDTSKLPFAKLSKFCWKFLSQAMTVAVLGGREGIVECLMAAGSPPDYISLAAAILTRNIRLFELFLDTAQSFDQRAGLAALAVRWGSQHVLELLSVRGVSFDEDHIDLDYLNLPALEWTTSTLNAAMERDDQDIFHLLLNNGVNCNAYSRGFLPSPLEKAIDCDRETCAYTLLKYGADPRDPGALSAALRKSHTELAEAILKSFKELHPHHNGDFVIPALCDMIEQQNEKLVRMLVSYIHPNILACQGHLTQHLMPLGSVIATGNVKIVQILLESGIDPDSTVEIENFDTNGGRLNAVLKAISTGNLTMVQVLREAGADLKFSATVGITRTSLQLAIELGHFEIVEYLLNQDVDVNAPPCIWEGGTALQFAAKTGSVRIAELLFERGAEINHPGSKYVGRTAFEFAAENGRIDMLLWLFHQGVDIASDGGKQVSRACIFAEENGQIAARDLVKQLGMEAQQNFVSTSYQTFW
ncbi:hypothetical protein COCMIDRAFT_2958 [Bipolaris oryzae ATCC 44560]|uniref:Clr5 domain-containing protein n=1 Tax=Bipolaris oryzae ATCC 44560 TaxID=930090 RepID=W6ZWK6_COCMI|nr:uncharacterized protein COCMIDRAFT_2958 [Bipolaris oryzae ATCC 44560]EUC48171.1 hypothetical protein COCMIDRAFT_2958 [Bipolaris oryzae ATCC 44560]